MTPKEKHQEEQNELKTSRINRILESAFSLCSEKGIDTITMTDIASTAEIGVASLYRYFATKDEIAIVRHLLLSRLSDLNELVYEDCKELGIKFIIIT